MSNNIENRVVQLEMRNSSLEKGANQSIKTLDKLDKALDLKNGKRSFEDVEKAAEKCNFEPLLKAADTVTQRFSTMGIMGVRALERITDKAVDAGLALTKSLTVDQIASGYSKYEQKTASVQTLINSTGKSIEEVNSYLDRLMWFSDETSYGFTDMTRALATMTSSGGDIDKLIPMIEGVANSVAFAGKGAAEFQRVMYNLNQSYSGGYLTYMDWKSVQLAGASSKQLQQVFIDTAVALGKIKEGEVTLDNFATTLQKKWADRTVMEKAFGYFDEMTQKAYEMIGTMDENGEVIETASRAYEILAEQYDGVSIAAAKSAQEAKTFGEAIDATKDAVSSRWMRIFETIFGNYEQQKELWTSLANSLWDIFAGPLDAYAEMFEEALQDNPVESLVQNFTEANVSVESFRDKLIQTARDAGIEVDEAAEKVETFGELLSLDWVNNKVLTKALEEFGNADVGFGGLTQAVTEVNARELTKRMNSGEFGYGIEAMTKNLKAAGFEIKHASEVYRISANDANASIKMVGETTEDTSEQYAKALELAKDFNNEYYEMNSGRTIGLAGIKNILAAIGDRLGVIKTAWGDTFSGITAGGIKNIIVEFHKWSETLKMGEEEGVKLSATFTTIFGVLKRGLSIIGKFGKTGIRTVKAVKGLLGTIKNTQTVQKFFDFIDTSVLGVMDEIDGLGTQIDNKLTKLFDDLNKLDWDGIVSGLAPIGKLARSVWRLLGRATKAIISFAMSAIEMLGPIAGYLYNNIIVPFANFIVALIESDDPIQTLKDGFISLGNKGKKALDKIVKSLKNGKIASFFADALDKISPITDKLSELGNAFGDVIAKAKETGANLDLSKIISVTALVVVMVMLSKMSDAFNKIGDAAKSVKDTFKGLNNIISRKFGNSFANNAKAVAGAIVAIAGSLYVLSKIPKEALTRSTIALGSMMLALGIIAGVLTFVSHKMKVTDVKKAEVLSKPILIISAAMLILSEATKNASAALGSGEQTWGRVLQLLAIVGGVGLELIGLAWLMTKVSGTVSVGAVLMLVIAVAVLKLAQALNVFQGINLSDDAKGILALVAVLALIGLVVSALGKTSGKFSTFANLGMGIVALVGAVYLAALAIETITNTNFEASFGVFLGAVLAIAVGLAIVIIVLAVVGKKLEAGAKSIALVSAGVLLLVAAVYLMTNVVDKLAALPDNGNTANAILGVVMIGVVIAAMTAALGYAAESTNGGKGVIKIVLAVMMMTLAVGAMSLLFNLLAGMTEQMSGEQMFKAIGLMAALAVIISVMVLAIGGAAKLGGGNGVGLIVGAVAALVVIATVLVLLSSFSWGQLMPAMVAITVCVLALGGMMLMVGGAAKLAGKTKGGGAALIAGVGLLVAVALGLAVLSQVDTQGLVYATAAMVAVLITLSISMAILGDTKLEWKTILGTVSILAAVILGLCLLIPQLEALAKLDTMSVLKNMAILVGAILILLVGVGVLAAITALVPGMTIAMAVVAVVLLAIAAVVGVFALSMNALQSIDYMAIATGMMQIAIPLAQVGSAGILLIIGAVGVIAMALALVLLGLAGSVSANGITTFHVVLISLLNTLSAVGNAFQNANGSILGGLANLRDELDKSAEATAQTSEKLWSALAGGKNQNGIDTSAITEGISEVIPDVASNVTENAPQLGEAVAGAVSDAGETASEEATAQGESVGNSFFDSIKETISGGVVDKNPLADIFEGGGFELSGENLLGDIDFSSIGTTGGEDFIKSFTGGISGNTETTSQAGNDVGEAVVDAANQTIESKSEETSNSILTMFSKAADMLDFSKIGDVVSGNFMNSLGESFLTESGADGETLSGNFMPLIQSMVDNTDLSGIGNQMGTEIAESTADSLESNANKLEVSNAATTLGNEANSGAKKVDTFSSGSYWGEGFNNGMWSWAQRVWDTAYKMGQKAVDGIKAGTEEGSPCKTTIRSGQFFGEGLVIGIDMLGAKVQLAGYRMGLRAAQAVEDGIQNGNQNGIVPVLDMSDVYDSIGDFDDTYRPVIKPTLDMSDMDPSFMNMQAVVAHKAYAGHGDDADIQPQPTPTSFNFTQNNYSPKALSRVAIYRQTKNQFAAVKDMIKK